MVAARSPGSKGVASIVRIASAADTSTVPLRWRSPMAVAERSFHHSPDARGRQHLRADPATHSGDVISRIWSRFGPPGDPKRDQSGQDQARAIRAAAVASR